MAGDLSVDQLESIVRNHWRKIVPESNLRLLRGPTVDAGEYVELHADGFHLIVNERGQGISHLKGFSLDAAARHFLYSLATGTSINEELRSRAKPAWYRRYEWSRGRIMSEDSGYSRWNWFYPTIEKMHQMAPRYGEFAEADVAKTLARFPLNQAEVRNARFPLLDFAIPPEQ